MSKTAFDLPIKGATAFAAIAVEVYQNLEFTKDGIAPPSEAIACVLPQSTAFEVICEIGDFWQISMENEKGYVRHAQCFINLPDVLPSAIYNNTNATASVMRACGREIPGLTGKQLYQSRRWNARLGKEEYTMPVLYHTAKKLAQAQQAARRAGDCIVVYELFRMLRVQKQVVDCLWAMAQQDAQVMESVTAPPWEMDWFIATGVSNHQRGMAMDIGLAKVEESALSATALPSGDTYTQATVYTLYEMPTPIHELGRASASLAYPVTSRNDTAWRITPNAPAMTDGACRMRSYCAEAGLTPLASEWWHFNDLTAVKLEGTETFVLV